MDVARMVDWNLAMATVRRLVRPGPEVSYNEAQAAVNELREAAGSARGHVAAFTRLPTPPDAPPAVVLDRTEWARRNVAGFQAVLTPVVEALAARREDSGDDGSRIVAAAGRRFTGLQVGTLLSYLAGKVLGQYEVFGAAEDGRLLLVAPNIVATERSLGVTPRDFRLWVALHEECHRVQFTAVPWLRDHIETEVRALVAAVDLDTSVLTERLTALVRGPRRGDQAAGARATPEVRGGGEGGLLALAQTPEQRAVFDRVQAFMSLIEGHAEYVMDGVGPGVVPTMPTIRARFDARRKGGNVLDRVARRILGLDVKMRQYAEGQRFVRAVVDRVGMDGFNEIWTAPEALPSAAEIADPDAWIARVLGDDRPAASA